MDDEQDLHLSYLILDDAAHGEVMETYQWDHLSNCEECMQRLAGIMQVRIDVNDFRKKYSA